MKTYPLVSILLALPFQVQAATLLLPASPASATSPNPATNPNISTGVPGVATVSLDTTHAGTATSGAYVASATGGVSIALLSNLATAKLATHTTIGPSDIKFGTSTTSTGALGLITGNNAILGSAVGAGLSPQWSATIDLSDLGINLVASGTYEFSFNLAQTTSLLGDISPAVLNRFTVSVDDTVGVVSADVLGLTSLTSSNGVATFRFTTGSSVNDPKIRLGASALLDTDLLGGLLGQPNPTLYTVSGLNLTAVPEPDVCLLFGMVGTLLLIRRYRP